MGRRGELFSQFLLRSLGTRYCVAYKVSLGHMFGVVFGRDASLRGSTGLPTRLYLSLFWVRCCCIPGAVLSLLAVVSLLLLYRCRTALRAAGEWVLFRKMWVPQDGTQT